MISAFVEWVNVPLPEGSALAPLKMLTCSGRDQVAMRIGLLGWSMFEPPMPELFYACAKTWEGMLIDVGANTGFYSLLGAAARQDLRIWAFEPDPCVRPLLEKNIELNHVNDRITVFPLALSDMKGTKDLYIPVQDHGLVETSSSLEKAFKGTHSKVIKVQVTAIDDLLSSSTNLFRKVGIIKVDVEGHEAAVLRGACKTVREHRPLLFVEVLPSADFDSLNAFLSEHSYKDMRLQPTGITAPGNRVFFDPDAWNHVFTPAEKVKLFIH